LKPKPIVLGAVVGLVAAGVAVAAVVGITEFRIRRVPAIVAKAIPSAPPSPETPTESAAASESLAESQPTEAPEPTSNCPELHSVLEEIANACPGRMSIALHHPERDIRVLVKAHERKPSASLAKLWLLCLALMRVGEGTVSLDQEVAAGSGPLRDLLRSMVTESDNAAANILIDAMGLAQANEEIHACLGLSSKSVLDRKMLDTAAQAAGHDNTTTAEDTALLLLRLKDFQYLPVREGENPDEGLTAFACGLLRDQKMREKIPSALPGDIVVANKTGELDGVENDAAIVYDSDGAWWVLVVMVDQVEDREGARDSIRAVAAKAWEWLHRSPDA